jgi:small subunit ribosomal protein S16
MAVVIRMRRTGRRNRPCYRITVADSRSPRDGRLVEHLGLYDPLNGDPEKQVSFNVERAKYWVGQGAQPSETVTSIFKRFKVYEGRPKPKKRDRSGRAKTTAAGTTRQQVQAERKTRKEARQTERIAAKRAAAKAAAAAEATAE